MSRRYARRTVTEDDLQAESGAFYAGDNEFALGFGVYDTVSERSGIIAGVDGSEIIVEWSTRVDNEAMAESCDGLGQTYTDGLGKTFALTGETDTFDRHEFGRFIV